MLILRCTAKLLKRLKVAPVVSPAPSTTRLGDWYATIIPSSPAHLVLLVNESTRLPVVLPARELSTLARRLPDAVTRTLLALGVDASTIEAERLAMGEVVFAKTASRSVLGTMNEFVYQLEWLRHEHPRLGEHELSMQLGDTLMTVPQLGYVHPAELTRSVLASPSGAGPAAATAAASAKNAAKTAAPVRRAAKPAAVIYELKVTLEDIEPPIWRRIRVYSDITLPQLHGVLQSAMGWTDSHLHDFRAGETTYGVPDHEFPLPIRNERGVSLQTILRKPNDALAYLYDFGDDWRHDVRLERVLEAEAGARYPVVVEGRRSCPPEDCGGTPGYEHLLEVLADKRHGERRELVEWVGGSFDPEAFDVNEINRRLRGD